MTYGAIEKTNSKLAGLYSPLGPFRENTPIYSWLSLSQFSPYKDDIWCRGGSVLDHEIVLLPGYSPPVDLDKNSIDSVWFEGAIKEPTIVWDGGNEIRMFEIISECFDPEIQMRDFIKVQAADRRGVYLDDILTEELRWKRPVNRSSGLASDYQRQVDRAAHLKQLIMFNATTRHKVSNEVCNFLGNVYTPSLNESYFHPSRFRPAAAGKHPLFSVSNLFESSDVELTFLPGMKFGLLNFEAELNDLPEWYMAKQKLDYYIAAGYPYTPEGILANKKLHGMPLTAADLKLDDQQTKIKARTSGFWGKFLGKLTS